MSPFLSRLRLSHLLAVVALVVIASPAVAQNDAKPRAASSDIDSQEEAAALEFARVHHPELAKLLGPMKATHPKEYQKALRELFRVSDRLTRMQTRFPERSVVELDLWKSESRLRLVAAKTAMVDDEERREQIEKLANERNTLKVRLYELERAEAESRIAQLDKQIESLKGQESDAVRKEVDRLVHTAKSSAKRVKTKLDKPAEVVSPPDKPKSGNSKRAPGTGSAS